MVLPFENGSADPARDIFVRGITEEVIGALIRFKNVLVFGADTSFHFGTEPALRGAVPDVHIDYVMKGSIDWVGSHIQVNVSLLRASDNQYLWSDSFRQEFIPSNMVELRHDIATQVARVLVQPHGVIDQAELRNTAGRPSESLSSYECVLRTREYWRQPNAEMHKQVRACLERAIQRDPDYADAWAALAFIYTDEVRVGFNPSAVRPDPAGTALQIASRAVALAPDNPLPLQALGIAHWLKRDVPLSIAAYEHALALNPYDSDIVADLGRAYSLTGDWDKGIPLIREAFERNPAQPSWYRLFIALFHYMHGRYDEALAEAQRIGTPDLVYTHVVLAMIHGQTGQKDAAAHEVNEILRLHPNFGDQAVSDFERRNIDPAIIAKMIDGLTKAGLPVSPNLESADGKG
jgi:TolB-like protein